MTCSITYMSKLCYAHKFKSPVGKWLLFYPTNTDCQ